MKVHIVPHFADKDTGEGGIRRVVEAQRKYLPAFGWDITDDPGEADLVAVHGAADSPVSPLRCLVSHCHGLYWAEYEWAKWFHEANQRVISLCNRADLVTAPSEWVRHALSRNMMIDPVVWYQGIEPKEWPLTTEPHDYVLWNKSRPDPVCDPEPVNELAKRMPGKTFVSTYGEPADNVQLVGRIPYDEMRKLVMHAGVYLATTRETFGIGTLEAMACGVPVVGWAWGGQREIIEHGVTGWLAVPGDYDSLVEGIAWAYDNATKIGTAARRHVLKNFAWRDRIGECAALYTRAYEAKQAELAGPKVSVVITCYNLATTLPRAVASVAAQENWAGEHEVVIVNDASPDNTAEVAATLAAGDDRIRVVTNSTNRYLSGALNAGISASHGRYVIPLDADNELGPRALSILSGALDADREIDIAYGAMEVVDESAGKRFMAGWPGPFDLVQQLQHRNQLPSTSMYRRRVWERVGGYRRRCRTAEDADFWCRATSWGAKPVRITDAPTLIYHDRSDSMSHTVPDWDWTAWYSWARRRDLTPANAARVWSAATRLDVPSFEPTLVSVVVPVGPGHGIYVQDAVDSVVSQTFRKWELIVVNDSGEPLPPLPPFVRVLITSSTGGQGPAKARNTGAAQARGRALVFLDSDDFLQPEALEVMYKEFDAYEGRSYVYPDWVVAETNEPHDAPEYDSKDLLRRLTHTVTAMYPWSAWKKVGGFDETLEAWEDWDFALSLARACVCGVRVPYKVFRYRMHAGTRREELYANRETLKENMLAKWGEYIKGGKELMACGGCGQRAQGAPPPPSPNGASAPPAVGMTLLKYLGSSPPITYLGRSTGTAYRFGADQHHQVRYVHDSDVEHFLGRLEFRRAEPEGTVLSNPPLQADGPPVREREKVATPA